MDKGIRLVKPHLPELEKVQVYFDQSIAKNWYTNYGPCYQELSHRLALRANRSSNLILTNATVALETVMKVLFQKSQVNLANYVLVPSYTFSATVTAITNIGLKPIYVDVDLDDWHMSAIHLEDLAKQHHEHVVGILACSTFGTLPSKEKLAAWKTISDMYNLKLVIDSAAGYGNDVLEDYHEYEYADAVVYSMHATKPYAVGEGGIIFANQETIKKCKKLSQFGFDENRIALPDGTNGKISEIMCAFGLAALENLDQNIQLRRRLASYYQENLGTLSGFAFQKGSHSSTWQSMFLQVKDLPTKILMTQKLKQNGIEFREDWGQPLHEMIRSDFESNLTTTEKLGENCLSLPIWIGLTEEEIVDVCKILTKD